MNFQQYQQQAARTAKMGDDKFNVVHASLGMTTEVGEVTDTVKRHIIYDKPLDLDNIHEELGDLMWYVALMATALNMDLGDICQANIDKLRKRFPGAYTDADALARADKADEVEVAKLQAGKVEVGE